MLPVSGWASKMFDTWHDQEKFLVALEDVLRTGHSELVSANIIGPGYVALASVIHRGTGLDPEMSLVVLNRASYAVSIAAALVLVRLSVTRIACAPPMISLATQLGFVALVFATGTWWWSDVPWTHFVAAALAAALFAVRFGATRPSTAAAVGAGCLLALLAATRSFEFVALVLAWGLSTLLLAALRIAPAREWRASAVRVVPGAMAFVATTVGVYALTGKKSLFFLYAANLDRQSADVRPAEIAETPALVLGLLPAKIVQLMFDPCYLALCPVADYEAGGGRGRNLDLWSLPLAVQLPALVLIPPCLAAVGVLLVIARRSWRDDVPRLRAVQLQLEMTIASIGIALGYVAATIAGSAHLRYGFAREFMLPALLAAVVAVSLGACALWWLLAHERRRRMPSAEMGFVVFAALVSVAVVAVTAHARSAGLPRLEGRHLADLSYVASCVSNRCRVDIAAVNPRGEPVEIPRRSTLTFGCGSARPAFTVYVEDPTRGVVIQDTCASPRLVAAWPLVMGLPPGSAELAAVTIRNV
jgi:hypothetical protein